ncbi:primosomal protein N' [Streptomyces calidiresistens]
MTGERSPDRPAPPPAGGDTGPARAAEQLALLRETAPRPRPTRVRPLAGDRPVARVLVDKGLVHLDRYFDYAVPASMEETALPGVRVRVRFGAGERGGRREGGRLVDGFVVERLAESDFPGRLAPLARVLSTEPVLRPDLLDLCRAVADRYAGSLADVVQLAVPPRMARAEREDPPPPPPPAPAPAPGGWSRYPRGPAFLESLAAGGSPRAVWTALPGPGWPDELARAAAACLASGRGVVAVLPDGRAAARADAALTDLLGPDRHVLLTADAGPEARYRRWLAVNRGSVRAVIGTRAAMFAPVRDPGLVICWDDGDASHGDDRAPHPHAREVLLLRAARSGAGVLLGGHACTAEGARLVDTGWAAPLTPDRGAVRAAAPLIRTPGDDDRAGDEAAHTARLPTLAWRIARDALRLGPVLVQVPRRGYVPALSCDRCREPARCPACRGPLAADVPDAPPTCGWCGLAHPDWHCPACGGRRARARAVGVRRTAEELGRAFPGVPVRTSGRGTAGAGGGDGVLDEVPDTPALVVSTPGAEPRTAEGPGYAAALLLDGRVLLNRPGLRAGEETLRRWLSAAALVRPAREGGTVVVPVEPTLRPVQALVRWDPLGFAERELADRAELGFPPVSRMAAVSGPPEAVRRLLEGADLPPEAEILGPVELPPTPPGAPRRPGAPAPGERWERALVRVPPGRGAAMARALRSSLAARLAHREREIARVRVDPRDIG